MESTEGSGVMDSVYNKMMAEDGPGAGRTFAMLSCCVDAVLEGQPRCMVIGLHQADLTRLLNEFVRILSPQMSSTESFEILPHNRCVKYADSDIIFVSVEQYFNHMKMNGYRGWGEFWDHAAEDKALRMACEATITLPSDVLKTAH